MLWPGRRFYLIALMLIKQLRQRGVVERDIRSESD